MGKRMNALRVIAKYAMSPVDRVARAGVHYETASSLRYKETPISTQKEIPLPVSKLAKVWIKCSVCGCSLREDRLKKHMKRKHTERQVRINNPHTKEIEFDLSQYMNCSICGCLLKISRKNSHMRKAHKENRPLAKVKSRYFVEL